MNIKPEQIPDEVVEAALKASRAVDVVRTGALTKAPDEQRIRAALAAALPVLLGKPVAWLDPASRDVINAERKHEWMTYFGAGGKVKAELYTLPLYTIPTQDTLNADQ